MPAAAMLLGVQQASSLPSQAHSRLWLLLLLLLLTQLKSQSKA
jgi:hypothetical protein